MLHRCSANAGSTSPSSCLSKEILWPCAICLHINHDRVQGRRQRGGQWCPSPHLKSVPTHFAFGPPVAAYIQYCIIKIWPPFLVLAPLFVFCPPLLLNPGDGPVRVADDVFGNRIWKSRPGGVCGSNNICTRSSGRLPISIGTWQTTTALMSYWSCSILRLLQTGRTNSAKPFVFQSWSTANSSSGRR